ncbi:SDR family oxidoreductase [Gordonia sp. CPCC 205515]|uniref:SDR family oxidoreductase n=1 Tax=Gordonia sp. CPCC 205515 TaxID=3140791 RepID=UPI003AF39F7A
MTTNIIVTVGVGGMGQAITRRVGSGARIVLADHDPDLLAHTHEAMADDGYDVTPMAVDVSSAESVRNLARAAADLGPVRHLVHTAGVSAAKSDTSSILAVDLLGVALSVEEFGEVIAPGGSGVVIASMAGTLAAPSVSSEMEQALRVTPPDELLSLPFLDSDALPSAPYAYAIAKRANQLRTAAAAVRWGARGARINSISPGIISTRQGRDELAGESGSSMRGMLDASPRRRLGTPGDIAAAAAFLLGPDADFITGTDLLVDGGVVAARMVE